MQDHWAFRSVRSALSGEQKELIIRYETNLNAASKVKSLERQSNVCLMHVAIARWLFYNGN